MKNNKKHIEWERTDITQHEFTASGVIITAKEVSGNKTRFVPIEYISIVEKEDGSKRYSKTGTRL